MFKLVPVFLFGVLFFVAATRGARLSYDGQGELDSEDEENQIERQEIERDALSIDEELKAIGLDDNLDLGKSFKHNKRAFNNEQRQFQSAMLQAHNSYRARHCARALVLDDGLSNSAQRYAERLAATNTFQHSGTQGVGENLWASYSSQVLSNVDGRQPAKSWYDEVGYYNFNQGGFSSQTGHFTQVVWKGTARMGAGLAYNRDRTKVYVVAHYSPPGNYQGQYGSNVSPARC